MKLFIFTLLFSLQAFLSPKTGTTKLPAPIFLDALHEEDGDALRAALSLTVHQDSKDPNLYYYMPPFRVFNYAEGAATYVTHSDAIDDLNEAQRLLSEAKTPSEQTKKQLNDKIEFETKGNREAYKRLFGEECYYDERKKRIEDDIEYCNDNIKDIKKSIEKYEEKLMEVLLDDNQRVIKLLEDRIAKKHQEIEQEKSEIAGIKKQLTELENAKKLEIDEFNKKIQVKIDKITAKFNHQLLLWSAHHLGASGAEFDANSYGNSPEEIQRLQNDLKEALKSAYDSYGGYMTLNVYAGFTKEQVDSIYDYLKLMPQVKLALMPGKDFEFHSLSDIIAEKNEKKEVRMFGKAHGMGNYTGSTVMLDLTLAGAKTLDLSAGAFIVPLGVTSVTTFKHQPFKATLDCKMSSLLDGWARGDIKDGLVVFNNDKTVTSKVLSNSESGCSLKLHEGSYESAEYHSLKLIKETLSNFNAAQAMLTESQAAEYNKTLQAKLDSMPINKKESNDGWSAIFLSKTFGGAALLGLGEASKFYWHTTKEDFEKIVKYHFKEDIELHADEQETLIWPTKMCFYHDGHIGSYQKCTPAMEKISMSMSEASKKAEESKICDEAKTTKECGQLRAEEMRQEPPIKHDYQTDNHLL